MDIVVLIPESTRKDDGGDVKLAVVDSISNALPPTERKELAALRKEMMTKASPGAPLPAYLRFQGNMYRHIPRDAWEKRTPGVEVVIVSGLYGLLASRDQTVHYEHSMAEPMPPYGKLNRWWNDHGLPKVLAAYLKAVRPRMVVDLLSLAYREAVIGFADLLTGVGVKTIDFPGTGRASQPRRGEKVAEILRTGKA